MEHPIHPSNVRQLIRWNNHDTYYNLAAEEYVFTSLDREQEYLLLWQNRNAVVVGKHQNTVEEINADYVREHGVQVVRRLSSGGAVYHDLGNLNYSFIVNAPTGAYNLSNFEEAFGFARFQDDFIVSASRECARIKI
jgi:lipoate-protein ligase A